MSEMPAQISQTEDDPRHEKYLTFALGEEVFGIEISFVTEIVGLQKVSGIPESPEYVKGVINLRGKIIPVIDMRLKLRKNAAEYTDRTCIVVVEIQDISVGLIVDRVDEVITIPDTSIVPPPGYTAGFHNRYIKGIGKTGKDIRLLLDCGPLFANEELPVPNQIEE